MKAMSVGIQVMVPKKGLSVSQVSLMMLTGTVTRKRLTADSRTPDLEMIRIGTKKTIPQTINIYK